MRIYRELILSGLASGCLIGAEAPRPAPDVSVRPEAATVARSIEYREREVPEIRTRLRYTTVFVLPKSEKIMDFVCGDKENWVINGADNFAYIKPEKEKARTNLNLITASGNVYSFLLSEGEPQPDLKVFVQPKDEGMLTAVSAPVRWIPASDADRWKQEAVSAKEEARTAKEAADKAVAEQLDAFKSGYPGKLKHVYRFTDRRPFQVSAIAHDGKFTYIWAQPQEVPALYEIKEGKPNLISFEFRNGLYVVGKVLDDGYLTVGKQRMDFRREE
ncbi:MAG: putative conjugal transfer protein [Bryobacterales bacterium]|nr:putative conjugal transfer protein [Bryobacterales bacterium]